MRHARGLLVLLTVLVLQSAIAYAGSIPIDIVSQYYRTQGFCMTAKCLYDVSGTESVYSPCYPPDQSRATIDLVDSQMIMTAFRDPGAEGNSLAEMVFRPRESSFADVLVVAGGWPVGDVEYSVTLQDISTGDWLVDLYSRGDFPGFQYRQTLTLAFNDSHEYALTVYARNRNFDYVYSTVTMPFTTAPDPGSTLLLLSIGLAGVSVWPRRSHR